MKNIKSLFYITHIKNLPSILKQGILCHQLVTQNKLNYEAVYNPQIVQRRQQRQTPDGKSLWEYAILYFQPRNPMLYQVVNTVGKRNVVVLGVKPRVIDHPKAYLALGNAAVSLSPILPVKEGLAMLQQEDWKILNSQWWKSEDGSKRKIMAECLVPDKVEPNEIHTIYVADQTTAKAVNDIVNKSTLRFEVVVEPFMFFQPRREGRITQKLSWVDGDLFFSQMQTLTISVNTVGVMGKGLASRAKYQFADVYVVYQEVCRKKILQLGKPYLYRREVSLDIDLVDEPNTLSNPNAMKWFLLFPTKRHWRERSDLAQIEAGLQWLVANYKTEGIQSIALPALGCGLRGLSWAEVGPLMCRYLDQMDIQAAIYLPQEQAVPEEYLQKAFLLGR